MVVKIDPAYQGVHPVPVLFNERKETFKVLVGHFLREPADIEPDVHLGR
jgi:hypothetical protein